MNRMDVSALCEQSTKDELVRRGHTVRVFGQAMLPDETRQMLRKSETADLQRWLPDFRVLTTSSLHCYVDSKFHQEKYSNSAVEMRSLLASQLLNMPFYYACSVWYGGEKFGAFSSIKSTDCDVSRGCCNECINIFHSSIDPFVVNKNLPKYCPNYSGRGSMTPFFLFPHEEASVDDVLFAPAKPCNDSGGRVYKTPSGHMVTRPYGYTDDQWNVAIADAKRLGYWK